MRKRNLVYILVILILLNIFSTGILAENNWSPDITKKLLELSREDLNIKEEPLLLYVLYFRELDLTIIKYLEYEIAAELSPSSPADLQIISDKKALEIVDNNSINIVNWETIKQINSDYISWMSTVGYNPIQIKINENMFSQNEIDEYEMSLEVIINPVSIVTERESILTDFEFSYNGSMGTVDRISSVNWISKEATEPIAVLNLSKKGNRLEKKRYFALYMLGTVVSSHNIEKIGYTTIGDTEALNKIFTDLQYEEEFNRFGIYFSDNNIRLNALVNKDSYNLQGKLDLSPAGSILYKAGIDYRLFQDEQLKFSARILNQDGEEIPNIALGISDKVVWSNLELKASYLPFTYQPTESNEFSSLTELRVNLTEYPWYIWYEGEYLGDKQINGLGLNYRFSEEWGLSTIYEIKNKDDKSFFLGLELQV